MVDVQIGSTSKITLSSIALFVMGWKALARLAVHAVEQEFFGSQIARVAL